MFVFFFLFDRRKLFSDDMTFENEFFEMAQVLEENSEMLNIPNKLSDPQVNEHSYSVYDFICISNRNVHYHI
jgi:hypothetical protein